MIETERLLLRQWRDEDRQPFAEMNASVRVMEYFPATLSRQQSDALLEKAQGLIAKKGWGFWALEEKASGQCIGMAGLHSLEDKMPFAPGVEIGWRLKEEFWGKGYAPEAASASLDYAFDQLQLDEVVSFTTVENMRSQRVMQKLGMHDTGNNFMHPDIKDDSPLQEHVLYAISRESWRGE